MSRRPCSTTWRSSASTRAGGPPCRDVVLELAASGLSAPRHFTSCEGPVLPSRGAMTRRDVLLLALLAVLPVLAHAPAWWESRLLGPGDGAARHYPLRVEVWRAYARGDLPSWNPGAFSGTPLLAAYRPGAFYPPMPLLALLPPFLAFQLLVLASLAAAAMLTYAYLRRIGAGRVGAYASGLVFALGPCLVAHLGDTATVVAAPLLPLALLALAGGLLLAAPQLLPTLLAWREAGPGATGVAAAPGSVLPGVTGLVVRYVSHTPVPSLSLAALPLRLTHAWVRR